MCLMKKKDLNLSPFLFYLAKGFRLPETFAKFVILNFSQKSEESYSLFYKDFSLTLKMTNSTK